MHSLAAIFGNIFKWHQQRRMRNIKLCGGPFLWQRRFVCESGKGISCSNCLKNTHSNRFMSHEFVIFKCQRHYLHFAELTPSSGRKCTTTAAPTHTVELPLGFFFKNEKSRATRMNGSDSGKGFGFSVAFRASLRI